MFYKEFSAQGAIEYLLIIGAAILVVAVVIVALSGVFSDARVDASSSAAIDTKDPLRDLFGNWGGEVKTNQLGVVVNSPDPNYISDNLGVDFSFDVSSENQIVYCNLIVGEDLIKYYDIVIGENVLNYNFGSEGDYEWQLSCADEKGNISTTPKRNLKILLNPALDIELISPEDKTLSFRSSEFNVVVNIINSTESLNCTLNLGSDKISFLNVSAGENTFYASPPISDGWAQWSVSCTAGVNSSTSETRSVYFDSDSYKIASCIELGAIRSDLTGFYELSSDFDCTSETANSDGIYWNSGLGFEPITNFLGKFDGKGHTITGLKINRSADNNIGLFGGGFQGIITNVNLSNVDIRGYDNVGGLIGQANNGLENTEVSNCNVSGVVNGNNMVGGIIGKLDRANQVIVLQNVASSVDVTGKDMVGGISGFFNVSQDYYGTIDSISSSGAIKGTSNVGKVYGFFSSSFNDQPITVTSTATIAAGCVSNCNQSCSNTDYNTCGFGTAS